MIGVFIRQGHKAKQRPRSRKHWRGLLFFQDFCPGTYGSAAIVPVFALEANGRVSSVTNTTIAIAASAITSGTLGVTRGGTGFSSYTANGVIIGGLTSTSALLFCLDR